MSLCITVSANRSRRNSRGLPTVCAGLFELYIMKEIKKISKTLKICPSWIVS